MEGDKIVQVDYEGLMALMREFPENADVFERLKYMVQTEADKEKHILVLEGGRKIVAAGSVQVNPYDPEELWLKHVSVDPDHQNHGHGKEILREIFNFVADAHYILAPSSLEEEGFKYLLPFAQQIRAEYPDLKIRLTDTIRHEVVTGTAAEEFVLTQPHGGGSLQIDKPRDAQARPTWWKRLFRS